MITEYKNKADSEFWEEYWDKFSFENMVKMSRGTSLEDIFLSYLPSKGKILEAGCGQGQWVKILSEHGFDIIGLDYAKKTVDMLNKEHPDLNIIHGDILNLPFMDGELYGYISLGVIEHFKDGPEKAIGEIRRVLNQNGVIILTVPFCNVFKKIKYFFKGNKKGGGEFYQYHYTEKELLGFFKDFSVVHVEYRNPFKTLKDELSFVKSFYKKIYKKEVRVLDNGGKSRVLEKNINSGKIKKLANYLESFYIFRKIFGHSICLVLKKKQ